MFAPGTFSVKEQDILDEISEEAIVYYYFGITRLPCLINSPFRRDKSPSLSFFKDYNGHIRFNDFATGQSGNIFYAVALLLNTTYYTALIKVYSDIKEGLLSEKKIFNSESKVNKKNFAFRDRAKFAVTVRHWNKKDVAYWKDFGISIELLEYAEVYPISKIFYYKNSEYVSYPADKYAYTYIERKEGNITMKIYQPYNQDGFKWRSNHDKSVIGLWTKVPLIGEKICICSSLKDALCLWNNCAIPSIYLQGEGFTISKSAQQDLKERFKHVFICLDNDEPGLKYASKLAKDTGFHNIILPQFEWGKDISDYYYGLKNKQIFKKTFSTLFQNYV